MRKKSIFVSGILGMSLFIFGSAIAQSSSFSKMSYDERDVNVYHHYDQAIDGGVSDEQLKMMRDRRLENLVTDPNDYTANSDSKSQVHKHNRNQNSTHKPPRHPMLKNGCSCTNDE